MVDEDSRRGKEIQSILAKGQCVGLCSSDKGVESQSILLALSIIQHSEAFVWPVPMYICCCESWAIKRDED